MTTRWPAAFAVSVLLHACVVGIALWFGVALIKSSPPQREWMNFVLTAGQPSIAPVVRSQVAAVHFEAPRMPTPTTASEPDSPPSAPSAAAARPVPHAVTAHSHAAPASVSPNKTGPAAKSQGSTVHAPTGSGSKSARVNAPSIRHVDVTEITGALRAEAAEAGAADAASSSYQAMLERYLLDYLEAVPGLDDGLAAEATFEILPNGHATHIVLSQRSGNAPFDHAVIEAISSLALPAPPPGFSRFERIPITTHARR